MVLGCRPTGFERLVIPVELCHCKMYVGCHRHRCAEISMVYVSYGPGLHIHWMHVDFLAHRIVTGYVCLSLWDSDVGMSEHQNGSSWFLVRGLPHKTAIVLIGGPNSPTERRPPEKLGAIFGRFYATVDHPSSFWATVSEFKQQRRYE